MLNKLFLAFVGLGVGGCLLAYPSDKYDACADEKCIPTSWAKRFGNSTNLNALALGENAAGHTVIAGTFGQTLTLGRTVLNSPAGADNTGFVALLNRSGNPFWAVDWSAGAPSGSAATSIAVSHNDSIFVGGFIKDQSATAKKGRIVRYSMTLRDGVPTITPSQEVVLNPPNGSTSLDTEIMAISCDPEDGSNSVFALGRINDDAAFPCVSGDTQGQQGVFIAKFDADLRCQWVRRFAADNATPTAITARNSNSNGVWATGYFNGSLDAGGSAPLASVGKSDMFLVNLDMTDGLITNQGATMQHSATNTEGWIRPTAIDTDDPLDNDGDVIVVGNLLGTTGLSAVEIKRDSGFVGKFDKMGQFKSLNMFNASSGATDMVAITGILREERKDQEDLLHIVGTFSGNMSVDQQDPISPGDGNAHPFVSSMVSGLSNSTKKPTVRYFGGPNESPATPHNWRLTLGETGVTIFGEWRNDLDLSIPGKFDKGLLPQLDRSHDGFEIVVGHFDNAAFAP